MFNSSIALIITLTETKVIGGGFHIVIKQGRALGSW